MGSNVVWWVLRKDVPHTSPTLSLPNMRERKPYWFSDFSGVRSLLLRRMCFFTYPKEVKKMPVVPYKDILDNSAVGNVPSER